MPVPSLSLNVSPCKLKLGVMITDWSFEEKTFVKQSKMKSVRKNAQNQNTTLCSCMTMLLGGGG